VKDDKGRDETIGRGGKFQAPMPKEKNRNENYEEQVFQDPGLPIKRIDRCDHPQNSADRCKSENSFSLIHAKDS
jgi:hypothetical protein